MVAAVGRGIVAVAVLEVKQTEGTGTGIGTGIGVVHSINVSMIFSLACPHYTMYSALSKQLCHMITPQVDLQVDRKVPPLGVLQQAPQFHPLAPRPRQRGVQRPLRAP